MKNKSTIEKNADVLKETAKIWHDGALEISETIVDGTIETTAQWQKLFAKSLQQGTKLFGIQQEFVLDTLEGLKNQYSTGNTRLQKLLGVQGIEISAITKQVEEKIFDIAEDVLTESKKVAKTIEKNFNKSTKSAAKTIKQKAKDLAETIEVEETLQTVTTKATKAKKTAKKSAAKATKASKKTVAKATKKVATPKAKITITKKAVTTTDDLKKIKGVGPKMEGVLHTAGITTFEQITTSSIEDLQAIITSAGSRYKMIDPATWQVQAKDLMTKK